MSFSQKSLRLRGLKLGIGMKFCHNIAVVNMRRLMESDFRFDVIIYQRQTIVATSIRAGRCCSLVNENNTQHLPAHGIASLISCMQYLIYRTFVLVVLIIVCLSVFHGAHVK